MNNGQMQYGYLLLEQLVSVTLFSILSIGLLTILTITEKIKHDCAGKVEEYAARKELEFLINKYSIESINTVKSCNPFELNCIAQLPGFAQEAIANGNTKRDSSIVYIKDVFIQVGVVDKVDHKFSRYLYIDPNEEVQPSDIEIRVKDEVYSNRIISLTGRRVLLSKSLPKEISFKGALIFKRADVAFYIATFDTELALYFQRTKAKPMALNNVIKSMSPGSDGSQLILEFRRGRQKTIKIS